MLLPPPQRCPVQVAPGEPVPRPGPGRKVSLAAKGLDGASPSGTRASTATQGAAGAPARRLRQVNLSPAGVVYDPIWFFSIRRRQLLQLQSLHLPVFSYSLSSNGTSWLQPGQRTFFHANTSKSVGFVENVAHTTRPHECMRLPADWGWRGKVIPASPAQLRNRLLLPSTSEGSLRQLIFCEATSRALPPVSHANYGCCRGLWGGHRAGPPEVVGRDDR